MMNNAKVIQELEQVRVQNIDGLLIPDEVVMFAQDPRTELHRHFEWNNTKAAHQYRLEQARKIIRVVVTYEPHVQENMRGYVSLESDQQQPRGGYRTREDVMSVAETRAELLGQAIKELQRVQAKYQMLSELGDVFDAIDAAVARMSKKKVKKGGKKKSKKKGSSTHVTP
jgi:hypothetical protein